MAHRKQKCAEGLKYAQTIWHKVGAQADEVRGRLVEEVCGRILSTVLLEIHMKHKS
jgi:hypothetical protein